MRQRPLGTDISVPVRRLFELLAPGDNDLPLGEDGHPGAIRSDQDVAKRMRRPSQRYEAEAQSPGSDFLKLPTQ